MCFKMVVILVLKNICQYDFLGPKVINFSTRSQGYSEWGICNCPNKLKTIVFLKSNWCGSKHTWVIIRETHVEKYSRIWLYALKENPLFFLIYSAGPGAGGGGYGDFQLS